MRNGRFGSDGNHNRGRIRDKSLRIINFAASLNTERTEGALEANSFWEIRMRHDEDDANYGGVETKICGEPVPVSQPTSFRTDSRSAPIRDAFRSDGMT